MKVRIDNNICIRCGKCYEICPVEAINKNGDFYTVDNSVCINCLACERECPAQAVVWEKSDGSDLEDKLDEFSQENVTDISNCPNNSWCNNNSNCSNVLDEVFNSMSKEEKKQLKKKLRFIVEDVIAPKIEKLFLLFLDGIERISSCNKK